MVLGQAAEGRGGRQAGEQEGGRPGVKETEMRERRVEERNVRGKGRCRTEEQDGKLVRMRPCKYICREKERKTLNNLVMKLILLLVLNSGCIDNYSFSLIHRNSI